MQWKIAEDRLRATVFDREGARIGCVSALGRRDATGRILPLDPPTIPFLLTIVIDSQTEAAIGIFDSLEIAMERMEYFWRKVSKVRIEDEARVEQEHQEKQPCP